MPLHDLTATTDEAHKQYVSIPDPLTCMSDRARKSHGKPRTAQVGEDTAAAHAVASDLLGTTVPTVLGKGS